MTKRKKCGLNLYCFTFTTVLVFAAATAFGATIRVPLDQPDIQAGIDAAGTGDTVLVADGTYLPVGVMDFKGKAITVQSENGPDYCTIDLQSTVTTAFRFQNSEGPNSVLSGFTIIHVELLFGTPIVCSPGSPTINNCVMHSNAGLVGGILSADSSPTITNCSIHDTGTIYGSAVAFQGGAPTMTGCTITDNSGPWTGGIYLEDTSATISDCIISGNTATDSPGSGDPASVGGISCTGGSPNITGCTITDNTGYSAGGIYCEASSSSPAVTNCTISGNSGRDDGTGAIDFNETSGTITDCMIMDNTGMVGGIHCQGPGSVVITACTIIFNAGKYGGMYCREITGPTITNCIVSENDGPEVAGGMTFWDCSPTLTNCTITDNTGGANVGGIKCFGSSALTATNCILWGNTPDDQIVDCTSTVTYSDVDGGHAGEGNINAAPMLESGLGDYHLTGVSPCIDAGTSEGAPSTDIEGNIRPQIAGYDMGAYEYLADNDDDGVPDYLEMGPDPENPDPTYDGNNDGIPDSQQGNVFSCYTMDGGNYVTVACPDPAFFTNAGPDRNPYPKDTPPGVSFPFGFFRFTINGVDPGGAITVTLYLPAGVDSFWKFGPTPDDPTNHWYEFTYDGETGAEINDDTVTLHLVDGLRGDHDLNGGNGTIVDPGAPSVGALFTPTTDSDDSVCFISTVAKPW